MPKKGYKQLEEHKSKNREAHKNKKPFLGKKHTEESKRKISENKKGQRNSIKTEFKKGIIPWNKGKEVLKTRGKNHYIWKGGYKYKLWCNRQRKILKKSNGGFHTFAEWETLKVQYNWTCPACKRKEPEIKLTEDHIIPISKGGSNNIENIQPLCNSCNASKYNKIIIYEHNTS